MNFRKITIEDRDAVQNLMNTDPEFMNERNFSAIFLWSDYYKGKVCLEDDALYYFNEYTDGVFSFAVPLTLGNVREKFLKILEYGIESGKKLVLGSVSQNQKEYLISEFGENAFDFTESRDSMDYIYRSEDLMWLKGKKLSSKRNHINKFLSLYNDRWTYEKADLKKNREEILDFQKKWCKAHRGTDCENLPETVAIKKAIDFSDELGFVGGILRVDGQTAAFSLGRKVSDSLFNVAFEKADTDFQGSYAMINQQFAQANFEGIPFVNREEDLGIEGLRKAKLSYCPYRLTLKYTASLNLDAILK